MYFLHKHSCTCTRCGNVAQWGELYIAEAAGTGTRLRRAFGPLMDGVAIQLVVTPMQQTAACPACYNEADAARGAAAAREWEIAAKRRAAAPSPPPAMPGASGASSRRKTPDQWREELA